ncbi:hypothetical protein [Actinomadura fibrosa]|uniref:Uncharacterized protein n=1 Tax=Actinomadura fibrosa TaxID=111802 RepID=A0ABW2Y0U1_9ACTN|nr:hypothetical protein [Actinomadura fibrosa]
MMKNSSRHRHFPRAWTRKAGAALALAAALGSGSVIVADPAAAGADRSTVRAPICNVYNGFRYQAPGHTEVYVVIDGKLHWVPDEITYHNLWATWDGLRSGIPNCESGDQLAFGAYLAREVETGMVYLLGRTKRWIPNMTIFNQYSFNPAAIKDRGRDFLAIYDRGPDIPARV